jgi:glycerol-3-phosphate acyltransferase PlsY
LEIVLDILLVLFAYLCGSIPFGYILTYYYTRQDIRDHGSGNIGSTNVKRLAGSTIAIQTQLLDMFKGLFPVGVVLMLAYFNVLQKGEYLIYFVALAAILGHDFSIFLKFKGGKGVNTTLGASVLLAPIPVFSSVAVYYLVKWSSRYVSLASLFLSFALVFIEFLIYGIANQFYYLLVCALLIVFTHRSNINRLLNGTENRTK